MSTLDLAFPVHELQRKDTLCPNLMGDVLSVCFWTHCLGKGLTLRTEGRRIFNSQVVPWMDLAP